jgi:hypothetical protein
VRSRKDGQEKTRRGSLSLACACEKDGTGGGNLPPLGVCEPAFRTLYKSGSGITPGSCVEAGVHAGLSQRLIDLVLLAPAI